ncbi:MAG: hypothetical protein FWF78_08055 [Defluviitaleaceae bacterium]|nr:hypothetical protein [Defluviitaleaceae bacterium]
MNCANDYCLYNRAFECILDEVSLDSIGMCDDCIVVKIDENILEEEKKMQLDALESRS